MRTRAFLLVERLCCTCWITSRDWTWRIPLWPGRIPVDDAWCPNWPVHSIGSVAYAFESRILCADFWGRYGSDG